MTDTQQPPRLTGSDVVGLLASFVGVAWAALAVGLFQPTFMKMFADFGGALPALTVLLAQPLAPPLLALIAPAFVAAAIITNAPRGLRLAAAIASVVLALVLPALFIAAMYLPIFSMAQAIH